jgi:hypothetical protein
MKKKKETLFRLVINEIKKHGYRNITPNIPYQIAWEKVINSLYRAIIIITTERWLGGYDVRLQINEYDERYYEIDKKRIIGINSTIIKIKKIIQLDELARNKGETYYIDHIVSPCWRIDKEEDIEKVNIEIIRLLDTYAYDWLESANSQ